MRHLTNKQVKAIREASGLNTDLRVKFNLLSGEMKKRIESELITAGILEESPEWNEEEAFEAWECKRNHLIDDVRG